MNGSNMFTDWLRKQKDSSTSFIVERAMQRALARYGRMLNFYIDSRQKTAQVEILLKGEKEPLTLIIQEYDLTSDADGTHMIVKKATASREWIHTLVQDFVIGRKFPVPEKYANIVRMVA